MSNKVEEIKKAVNILNIGFPVLKEILDKKYQAEINILNQLSPKNNDDQKDLDEKRTIIKGSYQVIKEALEEEFDFSVFFEANIPKKVVEPIVESKDYYSLVDQNLAKTIETTEEILKSDEPEKFSKALETLDSLRVYINSDESLKEARKILERDEFQDVINEKLKLILSNYINMEMEKLSGISENPEPESFKEALNILDKIQNYIESRFHIKNLEKIYNQEYKKDLYQKKELFKNKLNEFYQKKQEKTKSEHPKSTDIKSEHLSGKDLKESEQQNSSNANIKNGSLNNNHPKSEKYDFNHDQTDIHDATNNFSKGSDGLSNSEYNIVNAKINNTIEEIQSIFKKGLPERFKEAKNCIKSLEKQMDSEPSKEIRAIFYSDKFQRILKEQKQYIFQEEENSYRSYYTLGLEYEKNKDFENALINFKTYLNYYPDDIDAYLSIARIFIKRNGKHDLDIAENNINTAKIRSAENDKHKINYFLTLLYEQKFENEQKLEFLDKTLTFINSSINENNLEIYQEKLVQLEAKYKDLMLEKYEEFHTALFNLVENNQFAQAKSISNDYMKEMYSSGFSRSYFEHCIKNTVKDGLKTLSELSDFINTSEKEFITKIYKETIFECENLVSKKDFAKAVSILENIDKDVFSPLNIKNFNEYCINNNLNYPEDIRNRIALYKFLEKCFLVESRLSDKTFRVTASQIIEKENNKCIKEASHSFYQQHIEPRFKKISREIIQANEKDIQEKISEVFKNIDFLISRDEFSKAENDLNQSDLELVSVYTNIYENKFRDSFKDKLNEINEAKLSHEINELCEKYLLELEQIYTQLKPIKNNSELITLTDTFRADINNYKSNKSLHSHDLIIHINKNFYKLKAELEELIKEINNNNYSGIIGGYKTEFKNKITGLIDSSSDNFFRNRYQQTSNLTLSLNYTKFWEKSSFKDIPSSIFSIHGITATSGILKILKSDNSKKQSIEIRKNLDIDKVKNKINELLQEKFPSLFRAKTIDFNIIKEPFNLRKGYKHEVRTHENNKSITKKLISDHTFLIHTPYSFSRKDIEIIEKSIKNKYDEREKKREKEGRSFEIKTKELEKTQVEEFQIESCKFWDKYHDLEMNESPVQKAILVYSNEKISFPSMLNLLIVPKVKGVFLNIEYYLLFNPLAISQDNSSAGEIDRYIQEVYYGSVKSLRSDLGTRLENEHSDIRKLYEQDEKVHIFENEIIEKKIKEFLEQIFYDCRMLKNLVSDSDINNDIDLLCEKVFAHAFQNVIDGIAREERSEIKDLF